MPVYQAMYFIWATTCQRTNSRDVYVSLYFAIKLYAFFKSLKLLNFASDVMIYFISEFNVI